MNLCVWRIPLCKEQYLEHFLSLMAAKATGNMWNEVLIRWNLNIESRLLRSCSSRASYTCKHISMTSACHCLPVTPVHSGILILLHAFLFSDEKWQILTKSRCSEMLTFIVNAWVTALSLILCVEPKNCLFFGTISEAGFSGKTSTCICWSRTYNFTSEGPACCNCPASVCWGCWEIALELQSLPETYKELEKWLEIFMLIN